MDAHTAIEHSSPDGAPEPDSRLQPSCAEPRVLMLGAGWFPDTLGGLERYYRALFEQLPHAHGVVIGPARDAPSAIATVSRHDAPLRRRLWDYWRAARRRAREADLIDAHFALYAGAPLALDRARGRPRIFHFHGPWEQESAAAGDGSRLRRSARHALERRALARADVHITLSAAFGRVLVEHYGILPWGIHVWPPGVALDRFTPGERGDARARLGIAAGTFVAVAVRRLVPRMGLELLLDCWEELAPGLDREALLLIVGEGPLRGDLEVRARCGSLDGRVRLLGRLPDLELVDAYRAADVAVAPSIAFEGFGLVVLEAAACGTPSVVSDAGGLPEAAAGLDPSLVVRAGDGRALGARLRAAAGGALPGRAATRTYAERFSWSALGDRHRDLYRRLAAGGHDGGRAPRVVYLDHVARLSGAEISLLRVLPRLQRVQTHVVLGEDGPLAARLTQAGVSVESLSIAPSARDLRRGRVRFGGPPPAAFAHTLAYVARLAMRLRRLRPDLVHANSLKAAVYGVLAARAAGMPVLVHLRDRIAEDYLPRAAVVLVRRLIAPLADGVVANSHATLQTLGSPGRQTAWVIPDSVEAPALERSPASLPTRFGMLGRIAPWKGQDLFLRAFAGAFADGDERAVIIGAPLFGEEGYERELHRLAAELCVGERVEFRGFREDIWRELASLDVLVHASIIPEPFGQVILEGMAAGLAVIAPDEGGPATIVEDGRTGRLFASRDPNALAAAMRELAGDGPLRERLGARARVAVECYRPAEVARRLEEVYEQLLRGGQDRWCLLKRSPGAAD